MHRYDKVITDTLEWLPSNISAVVTGDRDVLTSFFKDIVKSCTQHSILLKTKKENAHLPWITRKILQLSLCDFSLYAAVISEKLNYFKQLTWLCVKPNVAKDSCYSAILSSLRKSNPHTSFGNLYCILAQLRMPSELTVTVCTSRPCLLSMLSTISKLLSSLVIHSLPLIVLMLLIMVFLHWPEVWTLKTAVDMRYPTYS